MPTVLSHYASLCYVDHLLVETETSVSVLRVLVVMQICKYERIDQSFEKFV